MNRSLLTVVRCAQCGAHSLGHERFDAPNRSDPDRTQTGVVWCRGCGTWYPVEDGVLDLLVGSLAYEADLARFWTAYETRLRPLGLGPRTDQLQDHLGEQRIQQEHFDWYADNPTQTYLEYEQLPFWQARRRSTRDRRRGFIKRGGRFLDIGCANGRGTFRYSDLDVEIVAFDVSKALVRQAAARFAERATRARVTFLVADGSQLLPFESEAFDNVMFGGVLHHLTDRAAPAGRRTACSGPAGHVRRREQSLGLPPDLRPDPASQSALVRAGRHPRHDVSS